MVIHNYKERLMTNSVNHALALRIAELLQEKKMTKYRLAMNSGITHSTLKNIMHETIRDNLLSTVILIANGFDRTVTNSLIVNYLMKRI